MEVQLQQVRAPTLRARDEANRLLREKIAIFRGILDSRKAELEHANGTNRTYAAKYQHLDEVLELEVILSWVARAPLDWKICEQAAGMLRDANEVERLLRWNIGNC